MPTRFSRLPTYHSAKTFMSAPKLLTLSVMNFNGSIRVENIKFRSIIDQTGTFTYNCSKVIAKYLKPLCKNEYGINETQSLAKMSDDLPLLNSNEKYVLYDIDGLFTNIPLKENIIFYSKFTLIKR